MAFNYNMDYFGSGQNGDMEMCRLSDMESSDYEDSKTGSHSDGHHWNKAKINFPNLQKKVLNETKPAVVCCNISNSIVNSIKIGTNFPSKEATDSTLSPSVKSFFTNFSKMSVQDDPLSDSTSDDAVPLSKSEMLITDSSKASDLPPIGVFWDIENCQVPRGKSAVAVAQCIRNHFFKGYREAEFIIVCDVRKEPSTIVDELNDAQVNLIHVGSTSKNAADEKLRQSMRRFADTYASPACIILITGDINFAADINDFRHRKKIRVILLHNDCTSESLLLCADEYHHFYSLLEQIPPRGTLKNNMLPVYVGISNLPSEYDPRRIKQRLKVLTGNCGGRVTCVQPPFALIKFPSFTHAHRAQKRLEGECVFGNPISVGIPQRGGYHLSDNHLYTTTVGDSSCMNYSMGIPSTWFQPNNLYGYYNNGERSSVNCLGGRTSNTSPWMPVNGSAFSAHNVLSNASRDVSIPSGSNFLSNLQGYECPQLNNHLEMLNSSKLSTMEDVERSASKLSSNKFSATKIPGKCVNQLGSKRQRTPSPFLNYPHSYQYFNPIPDAKPAAGSNINSTPVELNITNLDHKISAPEMKQILLKLFSEHVKVLHLMVHIQSDRHYFASVKVASLQDAQVAISRLHRLKVGSKKMLISYAASGQAYEPQFIRWQVVNLLREIPGFKLPLFKFIELFESRNSNAISLSELHRLKDVVTISMEQSGRILSLNMEHRNTPSPTLSQEMETFCVVHYRGNDGCGWAEQQMPAMPRVRVRLPEFSHNITSLIASHNGFLPLSSIYDCYVAECGELEENAAGGALEHLVTCVPNVQLVQSSNSVKYLKHCQDSGQAGGESEASMYPALVSQMSTFSKEVIELLRNQPHCQVAFNKFIPAYHHYFVRQCRVANYGFTKLIDLLQALPTTIQVMGDGDRRVITLSHRAQVRRFTTDLIRALHSTASHQLLVSELPAVFAKVVGKELEATDYGLCYVEDLVALVPSSAITVSEEHGHLCLSLVKRQQAPSEAKCTLEFTKEVIELLSYSHLCSIRFNKFIPAYHHHFGYQCRLADYGFTKLVELFEAIPDIVEVEELEGEKWVTLRHKYKLQVLEEKVGVLVAVRYPPGLPVASLPAAFLWQYGYCLKPQVFCASNLLQLASYLSSVKVTCVEGREMLVPTGEGSFSIVSLLERQVLRVLIHAPDGSKTLSSLSAMFNKFFLSHFSPAALTALMNNLVKVEETGGELRVRLVGVGEEARRLYLILREAADARLRLSSLEQNYQTVWGHPLPLHGHHSTAALLRSLPYLVNLRGKEPHLVVHLHKNFQGNASRSALQSGAPGFLSETDYQDGSQSSRKKEEAAVFDSPPKWPSIWCNGLNSEDFDNQEPVVNLPKLSTPPANILQDSDLISPCKGLLSATIHPMLIAPHPSQLPSPHQIYSPQDQTDDQVITSGVRQVNPLTPTVTSNRKLKLAARFQTPIGPS